MNEFSKLNRDQMRKITGGVPPVCNVEFGCWVDLGPPKGILLGFCREDQILGCYCYREDGIGRGDKDCLEFS